MPSGNVQISTAVPYLGELFQTSKRPNALLKYLGGLQGGVIESTAKEFPIGVTWSIPSPSQPANLEGANAPTPNYRGLTQTTNVVQIFQEAVQITYLAQSDKSVSGIVPLPQAAAQGELNNPRTTEFQVMTTLEKVAQDANYSFLNGAFVNPANPASTALQTRGVITAISTNILDQTGDTGSAVTPAQYRAYINNLLKLMIAQNGYAIDEHFVCMAAATEFSNICAAYEAQGSIYIQPEAMVFGVKVRKILTRWGTLELVLDPDVPAQRVLVANMNVMGIVGLPVPNKGILFEEPLFKQGSADQTQIYGQMGIDHAPEYFHGLLKTASGISL